MIELTDGIFKEILRSSRTVYIQGSASTPIFLIERLKEIIDESFKLSLYHIELNGDVFLFDEKYPLPPNIRDYSLFVGSNARKAITLGRTRYVPIFLSEIPWLIRNHIKPDVTIINATKPDGKGFVSLGPTVEATKVAIENSKYVVAQLNDAVPRTFGDSTVPLNLISHYVECDQSPIVSKREKADQIDQRIGENVAELIPDGSTIQAGIGKIPDAAMSALKDRKHLGIHTELFSDGMMELVEAGAVDNSLKSIDKYHVIATFSKGEMKLYDFLDTNDTSVIRRNRLAHSINSAVEVDITGQVSAESIGTRVISGVGGQMDFVRGSSLSEGGKAIIALRSLTASGESKIVPVLKPGAGVTTTRNHVQWVVTEYGVADLRGKSIEERITEMIKIAHPSKVDWLIGEAKKFYEF
ncbi:hypothetical protein ApAK_05555 [Thermoplasmatales archaeon AK]|nr:hypothetical protein [Thermoplasmatales archaeon AK]